MAEKKSVLAGDIGGTKTQLAIFSVRDGKLRAEAKQIFSSKQYPGLEPVVQEFLTNQTDNFDNACFGIAGPVVEGQVQTPNLPWIVEAKKLAGSTRSFTQAQIDDQFNPPDWFPEEHGPLPTVIQKGVQAQACGSIAINEPN